MIRRRGSATASGGGEPSSSRGVRFQPASDSTTQSPFDAALGILTALVATWCVAGLSVILAVLYVTVRPFSMSTYRRLAAVWGQAALVDAVTLLLPNCRIYLTGDSEVPSPVGSSVLVANHAMPADWWALFLLGRCVGLRGNVKAFLRNEYLQVHLPNPTEESGGTSHPLRGGATNGSSTSLVPTNGVGHTGGASPNAAASSSSDICRKASPDISLMARLLHSFLDFPLINGGEDAAQADREQLFKLLRSWAAPSTGAPVHFLFYPECWSIHGAADRRSVHAKSNEFAKREGKPTLKHLLLPRTRGFNASVECLREASPVVYDVTMVRIVTFMINGDVYSIFRIHSCIFVFCLNHNGNDVQAYSGYDGSLPPVVDLSLTTLWDILRRKFPREVHLRIKRYSMEEVMQDSNWLFKTWAEKDRLLAHFARHEQFPVDGRGYCRHRTFDTRTFALETSLLSLVRLLWIPCAVPVLLLFSIPFVWMFLVVWLGQRVYQLITGVPGEDGAPPSDDDGPTSTRTGSGPRTPGSASSTTGTPYLPATPFASPSLLNWRDMFSPPTDDRNSRNNHPRR
jgi:Acyltransferase C-terminus